MRKVTSVVNNSLRLNMLTSEDVEVWPLLPWGLWF